jgi:hypothetical protein
MFSYLKVSFHIKAEKGTSMYSVSVGTKYSIGM